MQERTLSYSVSVLPPDTVERVRKKDRKAFEEVYIYYKKPLGKYLTALVNNEEAALDIYQETFIRVWNHLSEVVNAAHFEPWLYTIARNLAIDHLRHEKRLSFLPLPENEPNEPKAHALSGLLSREGHEIQICERICLAQALSQMSPQYRVCLLLQTQWGYPQKEIAKALQVSEKAVSTNVSRGFKQLQKIYSAMMNESNTGRKGDGSNDRLNVQQVQ